jgi:hypothetical protein
MRKCSHHLPNTDLVGIHGIKRLPSQGSLLSFKAERVLHIPTHKPVAGLYAAMVQDKLSLRSLIINPVRGLERCTFHLTNASVMMPKKEAPQAAKLLKECLLPSVPFLSVPDEPLNPSALS